MTTDLTEARRLHAALREVVARHTGEAADFRALRRMLGLVQAAFEAVDDAYCREKLGMVSEYASELLSRSDHSRWGRDAASGTLFLRQQILYALELFASRLYSIEALTRSGKAAWSTRSSFAQT